MIDTNFFVYEQLPLAHSFMYWVRGVGVGERKATIFQRYVILSNTQTHSECCASGVICTAQCTWYFNCCYMEYSDIHINNSIHTRSVKLQNVMKKSNTADIFQGVIRKLAGVSVWVCVLCECAVKRFTPVEKACHFVSEVPTFLRWTLYVTWIVRKIHLPFKLCACLLEFENVCACEQVFVKIVVAITMLNCSTRITHNRPRSCTECSRSL